LLFDDGWVLDGTSRAHKKVFDAITSFLILLPFITFAGANSHEPFGQNSHQKKKAVAPMHHLAIFGIKVNSLDLWPKSLSVHFLGHVAKLRVR